MERGYPRRSLRLVALVYIPPTNPPSDECPKPECKSVCLTITGALDRKLDFIEAGEATRLDAPPGAPLSFQCDKCGHSWWAAVVEP